MIGEIKLIGSDIYMETNEHGTLEKLQCKLRWYRVIYLYIKQRSRNPFGAEELREWVHAHRKAFL